MRLTMIMITTVLKMGLLAISSLLAHRRSKRGIHTTINIFTINLRYKKILITMNFRVIHIL